MKLELITDNTQEHAPLNPMVTYELVADMGKDGTKTVFESGSYTEVLAVFEQIEKGNLDIPNIDLYEDEMETLEGLYINLCLTAKELEIITLGTEQTAVAEVQAYKVQKENKFVDGLCPRNWENTDISNLSEKQINGILDNCGKCQRYSQCQKVAELNDKLKEINGED